MWTEYDLFTSISDYLACCNLHDCNSELFDNFLDGDESPAVSLNGNILQLLGSRIFSNDTSKLIQGYILGLL